MVRELQRNNGNAAIKLIKHMIVLGVPVTLEKALSTPRPSPDYEDMNFYQILY